MFVSSFVVDVLFICVFLVNNVLKGLINIYIAYIKELLLSVDLIHVA